MLTLTTSERYASILEMKFSYRQPVELQHSPSSMILISPSHGHSRMSHERLNREFYFCRFTGSTLYFALLLLPNLKSILGGNPINE